MSSIDMIVCIPCEGAIHISSMLATPLDVQQQFQCNPTDVLTPEEYQFLRMYNQFKKIDCLIEYERVKEG